MASVSIFLRISALMFLAIALMPHEVEGIICMVCENARSYRECDLKGKFVQCDRNQDSCQTETRIFGTLHDRRTVIRKSCKSGRACNRNYDQNPELAWEPTQCNDHRLNSVCRCCCATNKCNTGMSKCFGGCSYVHYEPKHGRYSCTSGTAEGSVCTFKCDRGYVVSGSPTSRCEKNKRWSSPTPSCRKVQCNPPITAPVDGTFWCTKNNSVGSICRYICNEGFQLAGSRMTICKQETNGASWSDEKPTCIKKPIEIDPERPDDAPLSGMCTQSNLPKVNNSTVECNQEQARSYERGTKCTYTCNEGTVATGLMETTCRGVKGSLYWSEVESTCQPQCRPRVASLLHGMVICDGKGPKEVCKFACNYEGYLLKGAKSVSCQVDQNGNAQWSDEFPICKQELVCDAVAPFQHGTAECSSATHNAGTVCNFVCDTNYRLVGYESLECVTEQNGPDEYVTWTHEIPSCELITCPPQSLAHGSVNCTDETNIGTECSFACDDNYQLVPETYCKNKCMPDGTYDSHPACCEPICPPMVPGNMLILIEASQEMEIKDWNGYISIIIDLLSNLVLGDESLRIAVLPFSDELKHSHFINFTSNHEKLVEQLSRMNLRDVKGDSAMHSALQNVPDYFQNLEPRVGGSEDQLASVLVFTTRKSIGSENNDRIKAAADSLSRNYEIMAVGYDDKQGDIDTVLNYVAGEGSFAKLKRGRCVSLWTDEVLALMKKRLCRQRTCLHRNHDHASGVMLGA